MFPKMVDFCGVRYEDINYGWTNIVPKHTPFTFTANEELFALAVYNMAPHKKIAGIKLLREYLRLTRPNESPLLLWAKKLWELAEAHINTHN